MITHRDVERMLAAVVARSFPELGGVEIEVNEIHSKRDFFTSGYDPGMALKKGRSRTYRVYVNPGLFRSPPSEAAIEAALAHELVHVVDYTRLSTAALEKFTLEYLAGNHAKYERATDLGALERGYGCGLIEYRRWLYGHVSPATVAAKRRDYLTPEEIEEWMERAGNGEQGTEEREKLGARSLHDTSSRGFPRTK
jgi:hypothetical protein